MTAENCAKGFRISKILEKLEIPEEKIEEFLTRIFGFSQKKGINPETFKDALIEFARSPIKYLFQNFQVIYRK
jgi:hypothetical protein